MVAEYKKALNYSFLLLKYRPRSKGEIISRLKKKKFPSSVIEKVLAYLEEYNYIDDNEFVRVFVSSCESKAWGPKRISFALKKLGISQELIEEALKNKKDYHKEIREIIEKRLSRYKSPNKYQKILRYLVGRGFYYNDVIQELEKMGVNKFENG